MIKISIIIPVFNKAEYLAETLLSVINQTHADWECIVVDDGSTDNIKSIVESFQKKDSRFVYLYQKNQGPSVARNNGILKSKGEYILPLDSDDLISRDYTEIALSLFQKHTDLKLVYCKARFFGLKEGEWNLPNYSYERLLLENIIFNSAIYKKTDYLKTEGYDKHLNTGLEDWDFWLSFIKKEDLVFKIPKVLFFYRITDESRNTNLIKNKALLSLRKKIFQKHKNIYNRKYTIFYWLNTQKIRFFYWRQSVKYFIKKANLIIP